MPAAPLLFEVGVNISTVSFSTGGGIRWMQNCGVGFGRFAAGEVGRRVAAPRSAPLPSRRAPHRLAQAELGRLHHGRGALGTAGTGATGKSTPRRRENLHLCYIYRDLSRYVTEMLFMIAVICYYHLLSCFEGRL